MSITVSSRSSVNFFTYASPCTSPSRAVTFQSIERTSSPGWYSRTSSKFIPRPLNTLRYCPANAVSMIPRVRSSMWRILLTIFWTESTERKVALPWVPEVPFVPSSKDEKDQKDLRHRQRRKDVADDRLGRHRLGLGFVADDDAVAQHLGANAL